MSRSNSRILDTGDSFPKLTFGSIDGGVITLPADFGDRWNILLFYRGHW